MYAALVLLAITLLINIVGELDPEPGHGRRWKGSANEPSPTPSTVPAAGAGSAAGRPARTSEIARSGAPLFNAAHDLPGRAR